MTNSLEGLAALPNRDDVTPVVRLLTQHIDVLEKELLAIRAERDEAFARGLELLVGGGPERPPLDDALAQEAASFRRGEISRRPSLSGADGELRLSRSAELPRNADDGRPAAWEQGSPATVSDGSGIEADTMSFIAAARKAAQVASATSKDERGVHRFRTGRFRTLGHDGENLAMRVKRMLDEHRRPILLGHAALVLALGVLQVGNNFHGASKPAVAVAPQSEMKVVAMAPPKPQSPEPAPLPTSPAEPADPLTTGAIPSEAAPQELKAPPQIPADVAAPESDAALYRQAVSDDPAALYEIASRASEGRGMPRDLELAARLFERAATQGLVPAQYRTAKMYEKGLGVSRELAMAKTWYQRAADNGNALAMHQLAVLSAEGVGGTPDYATAVAWFRRAAELGIRDSQFNLAVLLARGLGTAQDLSRSYTWFAIVAAQGDKEAAKKRDEVGARLGAPKVAAAKLAAERWRPETPDKLANEVAQPAQGWTNMPLPKRTASAGPL
jgi:localization factor PodJL